MSTESATLNSRTPVANNAIELDERGRPWIVGTNIKVIEVVLDHLANGFSPTEIHRQYPHLSMANIHAALAHYYAHQDEIDTEIRRSRDEYERLWQQNQDSPGRQRLRSLGLLP